MRLLATGDIHAPLYTDRFLRSVRSLRAAPDAVLLAGDVVERNNVQAFRPVYEYLTTAFRGKPIVAVFGNEEYAGFEGEYRKSYPAIVWLQDSYTVISSAECPVAVVGSRGALSKPTPWQKKHVPGIEEYYRALPQKIMSLIAEARKEGVCKVVLLTHYGVTFKDLYGEPGNIWDYLASPEMERVVKEARPDAVIHAHAHKGLVECVRLDGVPVYNASFPARGRPLLIDV